MRGWTRFARKRYSVLCAAVLAAVFCGAALFAQQQQRNGGNAPMPASDLANDNLDRVAASETQIATVLHNSPGLLVELKRWVAKDAADRGQVVEDTDLSDSAIYARLSTDQKFRAVATRLLQRYGYLVAEVNPLSEMGREQSALAQERIRQKVAAEQGDEQAAAQQAAAWKRCEQNDASYRNGQNIPYPQNAANTNSRNDDCQQQRGVATSPSPGEGLGLGFGVGVGGNSAPVQPDRDFNNQLGSPGLTAPTSTPLVLRTAANPPQGAQSVSGTNFDVDGLQTGLSGLQPIPGGPQIGAGNLQASLGGSQTGLDGFGLQAIPGADGLQTNPGGAMQSSLGFLPNTNGMTGNASTDLASAPMVSNGSPQTFVGRGMNGNERPPYGLEGAPADQTGLAIARHWSPYSDIPSLYDIFAHAETPSAPVERFGERVFRNVPYRLGTMPIDLPSSPDYVVGPGDGLTIDLYGGVSQQLVRTVDREGRVTLPEVGPLEVNGRSLAEVQEAVQNVLRSQFRNVSADVSLSRLRTVRVYVVGDIARPGPYDVSSLSTPLNALLAAGGPNANGSLRVVNHYRGNDLIQQVDLYDLLLHGVRTDIKRLEPGDTLLVPPVGGQVRIDGMVRRPGIYELHGENTLKQALDLAGGILPTATLSHVEVQRLEAHQKRTMLSVDISGATDAAAIEAKMASFEVRDRDEVHIFPIATFNQDAVYLQGHVLRAGQYAYKPGMKLTDVVSSYTDLLPEPATKYAEIIRLNAPDYHPSVESFDLSAALADPAKAPTLQPLDTVRIFSRFDFENAPTVSVSGAVRRPGTFQTSGQIHFRDAVQLSGGLSPNASEDSAQIIRLMPDSSLKILNVQLREVLAGNESFNVLLQPRDRILIHENVLRADPPSVLVGGEVVNPGRYALTQDLRVSDLIQMAGGLKRSAETDKADLTLYQPSNEGALAASHASVNLTAAMKGDAEANTALHDGDVLTIRQVPGWSDLQASISVQGEVKHPGTYGIRPGERLSAVLERAGGFAPDGYAYGAILQRVQVRELETQQHDAMIQRVKDAQNGIELLPETDAQQRQAKLLAVQQWQSSIEQLNENAPAGRVAIRISSDVNRWKNTAADIEVRSGDVLIVPKKPGYVMVTGQVFNPTAVSFRPGRSAEWYVSQSGGPTPLANKKAVFVIRADGSVIGDRKSMWSGDSLNAALQPGDMVVVPEKAYAGNVQWQNLLLSAQVASSIASTVFIALHY